jgi:hypothetical protein
MCKPCKRIKYTSKQTYFTANAKQTTKAKIKNNNNTTTNENKKGKGKAKEPNYRLTLLTLCTDPALLLLSPTSFHRSVPFPH